MYDLEKSKEWVSYVEGLEEFFIANKITEAEQKVAVLLTVIGPKAYSLLQNLLTPAKPADKDFDEIVQVLQNHLSPKPLIIAERFKFHCRNQGENESVAQYLAELRKLSENCQFGEYLEQALRDRLVCGLVSEKIQQRLLSEAELSLKKAFKIAQSMETAHRETREMRALGSQMDTKIKHMNTTPRGPARAVVNQATTQTNVSLRIKSAGPVRKGVT